MSIKNILVTGGRAPATLHLVRLLNDLGYKVFVADSLKHTLCSFSNAVERFYLIPSPRFETDHFIESLISIVKEQQIDLIFPTCEEIFYISQNKERLENEGAKVFTEKIETLDILHNKFSFSKLMNQLNIPTPNTTLTSDNDLPKKYILKPIYSRFSSKILFNINDLEKKDYEKYITQSFVEGIQYCVYGIAKNGSFNLFSIYKTEMTAGKGATISFKSIKNETIEKHCNDIIKHLNFTGQIAFDVIVDKDDTPYFIECNPRLTSGIHLFNKLKDLESKGPQYPNGEDTQLLLAMITYAISNIKKHKFKLFFNHLKEHKDVIYNKKDIKPFLFQFISYSYVFYKSIKGKKNILEVTTEDIEWNGDQ